MRWTASSELGLGVLIVIQTSLLVGMAAGDSSTWDEGGHLTAGIAILKLRRFDVYNVNPPLARAVGASPAALLGPEPLWELEKESDVDRPEFRLGANYAYHFGPIVHRRLVQGRILCALFAVGGTIVCYVWGRVLFGPPAGIGAATLWAFCPNVLGLGHLIVPDALSTALAAGAAFAMSHWMKRRNEWRAAMCGAVLGFACASKFTLLVLVPLAFAAALFGFLDGIKNGRGIRDRVLEVAIAALVFSYVINTAYAWDGVFVPLGRYQFVSQRLSREQIRQDCESCVRRENRLSATILGAVPVPLPRQYLLGIDRQLWDFEQRFWSYLRGEWKRGGWWYYYLYALAIKVPLGTWVLIFLAAWCSLFRKGYSAGWRDELVLLAPLFTILIFVSSQTGFSHHMRYVLPIFPFAFIWASKVFRSYELGHYKTFALACAALLWSVVSSLSVYPHSLSYFNELVGGPKGGHWHLGNSNIDWGQDLFYLKKWLDKHPEAARSAKGPIGISYDNIIEPSVAGIEYTRPPVGSTAIEQALPPPEEQGPLPGWYAISVNHFHDRTREYEYFLRFEPVAMAGYSIYISNITPAQANRVRRELGLPELP